MNKLSPEQIRQRWRTWSTDPLLSPSSIRQAGDGKLDDSLRSVYWRMYLGQLPMPHSSTAPFSGWSPALEHSRAEWTALRPSYLRSPDGIWVNDGPERRPRAAADRTSPNKEVNGTLGQASDATASNPLGLESSNPWKQWFADLELRKTLWQDVERTMPEIEYFRDARVQHAMVDILHVWSRLNAGIGYRQGMHELLAYLFWVVDCASLPSSSSPAASTSKLDSSTETMHLVLSSAHVEHDVWHLFSTLMKPASAWYDSTPSVAMPSQRASLSGIGASNDKVTLLQPIVGQAIRIFDLLLRRMDPELFGKLESLEIEPQLWAIRWIRLLFGREFPPAAVLSLWDAVFAEDASLRLVDHVCVAMLLRIRNRLLGTDYSGALQLLLRFPADAVPDTSLLVRQAIHLRDNPSPLGAASVHQQNIGLGLAEPVTSPPPPPIDFRTTRAHHHRRAESAMPAASLKQRATALTQSGGLVGDLALNVFERAEAMGLNKALGTLGEIRRNVGQYHAAISAVHTAPTPYATAFTPREPSPSISTSNAVLANAISLAVDALEKGVTTSTPSTQAALHALRHVSEVLTGSVRDFDPATLGPLHPLVRRGSSPVLSPTSPATAPATATTFPPSTSSASSSTATTNKTPSLLLSSRNAQPLSTSLPRVPYSASEAWRVAAKWPRTPSPGSTSKPVLAEGDDDDVYPKSGGDRQERVSLEAVRGDARRVMDDPLGAL